LLQFNQYSFATGLCPVADRRCFRSIDLAFLDYRKDLFNLGNHPKEDYYPPAPWKEMTIAQVGIFLGVYPMGSGEEH
jgi:hypothetical protein